MTGETDVIEVSFEEAYQTSYWTMVEIHENLSVPVSAPIIFEHKSGSVDVVELENALSQGEYAFLDVYDQTEGGEYYLSGTLYSGETNSSIKIKANDGLVRIFPRDDELTLSEAKSFKNHIEDAVGSELTPVVQIEE